jgi:outer membrane protein assembly factor BamB
MPDWITQIPDSSTRRNSGISRSPELLDDSTVLAPIGEDLFAMELDHGDILWEMEDARCFVQPLSYAGRLYVPSDDGHLYCYDLNSCVR